MNPKTRTTLIASAIAAMLAGSTWASSNTAEESAQTPTPNATKAKTGLRDCDQVQAVVPTREIPGMGAAAQTSAPSQAEVRQPKVDSRMAAQPSEAPGMAATAGMSIGDNPLYTRSGDDLEGVEVVDSMGNKIGDVISIVLAPDRKSAHAMIAVGPMLGIGAHDILVSLDNLKPMEDKLQMSVTKAEIESVKEEMPKVGQYVELQGDAPISGAIVEFSAFEQDKETGQPGAPLATPKGDIVKPATTPETQEEIQ